MKDALCEIGRQRLYAKMTGEKVCGFFTGHFDIIPIKLRVAQ